MSDTEPCARLGTEVPRPVRLSPGGFGSRGNLPFFFNVFPKVPLCGIDTDLVSPTEELLEKAGLAAVNSSEQNYLA